MSNKLKLIVIAGPTAAGKTAVSIELAKRLDGEVVSCDSTMIYRGMNLGTAKPTPEETRGIPHHLVDILEPEEPFDVATFQEMAREAIRGINSREKVPLLVGGTNLYIRAVIDDLRFPPKDDVVRKRLEERAARGGPEKLVAELIAKDPESAGTIEHRNLRRVIRALEVIEVTGEKFSSFYRDWDNTQSIYDLKYFGLSLEREEIRERLAQRVDEQLRQGLLQEVIGLAEHLRRAPTAKQAITYKELLEYWDGKLSYREAVALIVTRNRQYAKRQMTWLRADPRVIWVDVTDQPIEVTVARIYEDAKDWSKQFKPN